MEIFFFFNFWLSPPLVSYTIYTEPGGGARWTTLKGNFLARSIPPYHPPHTLLVGTSEGKMQRSDSFLIQIKFFWGAYLTFSLPSFYSSSS